MAEALPCYPARAGRGYVAVYRESACAELGKVKTWDFRTECRLAQDDQGRDLQAAEEEEVRTCASRRQVPHVGHGKAAGLWDDGSACRSPCAQCLCSDAWAMEACVVAGFRAIRGAKYHVQLFSSRLQGTKPAICLALPFEAVMWSKGTGAVGDTQWHSTIY